MRHCLFPDAGYKNVYMLKVHTAGVGVVCVAGLETRTLGLGLTAGAGAGAGRGAAGGDEYSSG